MPSQAHSAPRGPAHHPQGLKTRLRLLSGPLGAPLGPQKLSGGTPTGAFPPLTKGLNSQGPWWSPSWARAVSQDCPGRKEWQRGIREWGQQWWGQSPQPWSLSGRCGGWGLPTQSFLLIVLICLPPLGSGVGCLPQSTLGRCSWVIMRVFPPRYLYLSIINHDFLGPGRRQCHLACPSWASS